MITLPMSLPGTTRTHGLGRVGAPVQAMIICYGR
jgi:hypothetical protein